MIVSMLQVLIEVHGLTSLKDKRRIVKSLKDKLISKYKLSVAEIDYHDSLRFIQIGAALVSNSKVHGEAVLTKIFRYIEDNVPGRLIDSSMMSEKY
ncbi:MAG: DUF503 domain-containing protein [Spirochaetales bacterium]|nr:DUF503 domain-containing protein [Spirochaetales bacterium]